MDEGAATLVHPFRLFLTLWGLDQMKNTTETISIFDEELRWYRAYPGTSLLAVQRAIDYHRRYTLMECPLNKSVSSDSITPDYLLLNESNFTDANLSPESRVLFNDLVRQLLTHFVKLEDDFIDKAFARGNKLDERIATLYLARVIRVGNLEHILDDDLQKIVQTALGDNTPWTLGELAILCGYESRDGFRLDNDFKKEVTKIHHGLREFLKGRL